MLVILTCDHRVVKPWVSLYQGFSKVEDPGKGLVTQEKYGADMARLHRIFLDMVQIRRKCTVFFGFFGSLLP